MTLQALRPSAKWLPQQHSSALELGSAANTRSLAGGSAHFCEAGSIAAHSLDTHRVSPEPPKHSSQLQFPSSVAPVCCSAESAAQPQCCAPSVPVSDDRSVGQSVGLWICGSVCRSAGPSVCWSAGARQLQQWLQKRLCCASVARTCSDHRAKAAGLTGSRAVAWFCIANFDSLDNFSSLCRSGQSLHAVVKTM